VSELLKTVEGLQNYAAAAKDRLPPHIGNNLVQLSGRAVLLVKSTEGAAGRLEDADLDSMYEEWMKKKGGGNESHR
jgi:hypothetical protein